MTQAAGGPIPRRQHPQATSALVVGLLSVIGAVMIVPAALGPIACYLGASARRHIDREPARWDGRRQATTGLVLGMVASALFAVLTILMLLAAGLFALALRIDTGY